MLLLTIKEIPVLVIDYVSMPAFVHVFDASLQGSIGSADNSLEIANAFKGKFYGSLVSLFLYSASALYLCKFGEKLHSVLMRT